MNFYMTFKRCLTGNAYAKILLKLKLTFIILTTVILQVSATGFAQITLKEKAAPLEQIIQKIRKQTGYDFFYNAGMLAKANPVTLNVNDASVKEVLDLCFKNQPLTYRIEQKTIVVQYAQERILAPYAPIVITGKILDENGKPIPGASIRIKGTNGRAIASGADGSFRIVVNSEDDVLLIAYIGYQTQEIKLKSDQGPLTVRMQVAETSMKDVIITGTGITRNKSSFTGATATYSGEDLRSVASGNILQGLRTLDPSFIVLENNLAGANPNVLPVIEVRGKTSLPSTSVRDEFATDPNQPLFVLDGFETTLQTIVDMDPNRIASVTILKDAASTALYGARASNGVVVIESIKPQPGELRFSYSNEAIIEAPNLSVYNMMNATEKLEFERLSGRYSYYTAGGPDAQVYLDQLYYDHLQQVKRGVDTYWLNEPVQTGLTVNNSINAQGGDNVFTYLVGLNYKTLSGAMKGSGRDTWSGNVNLTYRKSKFNINNSLFIRGYSATNSPYGSFSNFVNANPYYEKNETERYLEVARTAQNVTLRVNNPLYDALLPNKNGYTNLEIQNNLNLNYTFNPSLQLRGGMQMIKGSTVTELFTSPESSTFLNTATLQKGKYTNTKTDNFSYSANLLLTYGRVFDGKHSVNANIRTDINNKDNSSAAFTAEGFPEGSLGNPRFAYSYQENSSPRINSNRYRTLSATASANYAYNQRYLFDISYRLDGSTAFGSEKQFSPFWSTGLGWNLHQESVIKKMEWITNLKLFGNIGVTGNQNYGSITSVSVYDYNSNTIFNQFGQGLSLSTLGNPNLEPQKSVVINTGLDFTLFKGRFSGYINAYQKKTDPQVVAVDLPSSTGVFNYPLNVGSINTKGLEARLSYAPIFRPADRIVWKINVTGSSLKSKYDDFGNTLAGLNKEQDANKDLNTAFLRYRDGFSPDDIWAVKSLGIDPATGREVFLTRDGQYTFDYNANNISVVGNTNPIVEGVFSTNLTYKGFTLGLYFRYRVGADVFNNALYQKVENISYTGIALNQDKRALYQRWQKPGDISQFKGISQTSTTPISSRFVQVDNSISGESMTLEYMFSTAKWLNYVGMKSLTVGAKTGETFRAATSRRERGIDYPFTRTVTFNLRASF